MAVAFVLAGDPSPKFQLTPEALVEVLVNVNEGEVPPTVNAATGSGFAVVVIEADSSDVQPFSVVFTVKVPAPETVMVWVVSPVDQLFPAAALELRVIELPSQMVVDPEGVITGAAGTVFTITVVAAEGAEGQPFPSV